jgi:hypothetical protein
MVGRALGVAATALGYMDGRDAPDGRGARRDGGHDRRGRALAPVVSQSGKEEGDDGDVTMTST